MPWKIIMFKSVRISILMILLMMIQGCATSPAKKPSVYSYHEAGMQAEQAGDYELAEQKYNQAYYEAESQNASEQSKALIMYNLGRIKGYRCRKADAEMLLLKSLEIEGRFSNEKSARYAGRLVEISRFYYDFGELERSLPYFEKGLALLLTLFEANKTDPITLADWMDDYGEALRKTGRDAEAGEIQKQSRSLRDRNPGQKARVTPIRYNRDCRTP